MNVRITRKEKEFQVKLQEEGRRTWRAFQKASATIPGFEELKQSGNFYTIDGAENGTNLYTHFPFLFIETFPEITKTQIRKLSLMSLLYLYHMLIDDMLMDEQGTASRPAIVVSDALNLKALEIMDDLFGTKRLPWKRVLLLHRKYSSATLMEAQHFGTLKQYRHKDLFRILSGKSSMTKLIIMALCFLSNRREYVAPLERSFDLYYLADQLFDDFRDWKTDLRNGRYTYLLTQVITICGLQEKTKSEDTESYIELIGKHLYLSGIIEPYLDEAISYLEKAKKCVSNINCPGWTTFINTVQMGLCGIRSNLSDKARKILLQTEKYAYDLVPKEVNPTATSQPPVRRKVSPPVSSIADCVSASSERAVNFICSRYETSIGFRDFMVFNEELPIWVSAYVGSSLVDWCKNKGSGRRAKRQAVEKILDQLASYTLSLQSDQGWGSNKQAPEDADTASWVMNLLIERKMINETVLQRGTEGLLRHRQPDGGFCTYLPNSLGDGFSGWSKSHPEVTAVVLEVLIKLGLSSNEEVIRSGVNYLIERQELDSFWQAYWWDSKMYPTYYILRALRTFKDALSHKGREQLIAESIKYQAEDGSWGEETIGKNKAFETSLAVRTLLLLDKSLVHSTAIRRAVVWLLNHQAIDGGWNSHPMMRVPGSIEEQPWTQKEWKFDLPNGVGILIRDQNRLFTTATVLSALTDFLYLAGDYSLSVKLKIDEELLDRQKSFTHKGGSFDLS